MCVYTHVYTCIYILYTYLFIHAFIYLFMIYLFIIIIIIIAIIITITTFFRPLHDTHPNLCLCRQRPGAGSACQRRAGTRHGLGCKLKKWRLQRAGRQGTGRRPQEDPKRPKALTLARQPPTFAPSVAGTSPHPAHSPVAAARSQRPDMDASCQRCCRITEKFSSKDYASTVQASI